MTQSLYKRYCQVKQEHPTLFTHSLAKLLRVTEAELQYARVGHNVIRLSDNKDDIKTMLTSIKDLGEIMALTSNDYVVHELIGRYENVKLGSKVGLALNPRGIDLRFFMQDWAYAFAVKDDSPMGELTSIQFFDHQGQSIEKIYATKETNMSAWQTFIEKYQLDHNPAIEITKTEPVDKVAVSNVDPKALLTDWQAMTDVHQFMPLLQKYHVSRLHAIQLAESQFTYRVENSSIVDLLEHAHQCQNEIMIFASNRGIAQIFTGVIEKTMVKNQWANVINEKFNLHLRIDLIKESWVVRKPTKDGWITSLELFAENGELITQLYGQRQEGQIEQTQWREQLAVLKKVI